MIINPCNKGNLLCKKLIFYNSTYEEDKPVIHKLNQQLLYLLYTWKKPDMDNSD
jgi:hypothetical protein